MSEINHLLNEMSKMWLRLVDLIYEDENDEKN